MFFEGCIREVGTVPLEVVNNFKTALQEEFSVDWQARSIRVMHAAHVLKAKSPTNIDALPPPKRERLWHLMGPILEHVDMADHTVVYADVSSLPACQHIDTHLDTILMHVMSRRIHVPVQTNERTYMGFITPVGAIERYNLEVGKVYEVNNIVPHAVFNGGVQDRWHILLDLLPNKFLQFVTGNETYITAGHIINQCISPITTTKLRHALTRP